VFASSSSVYGNAASYPVSEDSPTRPFSPYGVTKLAMEHLAGAYVENWQVPVVMLRYFTVYGPAQRPDMAMHRFIDRVAAGEPVPVYGDGRQVRDFTYVGDVATATTAAACEDLAPGTVMNIAGGSSATVTDVLALVGDSVGRPVVVDRLPPQPGDVRTTGATIERACRLLGWAPEVTLEAGVAKQVAHQLAYSVVGT
jgi:nucleoside-diphosphate-sugar epimerase